MLRPLRSASSRHLAATASESASWRTRPRVIDAAAVDVGVDVGQRAVGVVGRQVAAPHLLDEGDRPLRADLLQPDVGGQLLGVGVGVGDDGGGGRDDLEVVPAAAVAGQPLLDVGVERLPVGVARSAG